MPDVTCEEKYLGRQVVSSLSGSAQVEYIIQNTDDDAAAVSILQSTAPDTWNNLPRVSCEVAQIAQTIWEGVARYGFQSNNQQQSESNFSFETGGGTQHITQSLSTISRYAPSGKTAPVFDGAICVDNNSVNGCDITVPVFTWSDTYIFSTGVVTPTYKQTLFALTGKVNNASWGGYSAGEVLFMGASGSKRGNRGDWEIAFKFSASPNITGKTIGSITNIAKKGWEYLWVRYDNDTDTNAKVLIKKPVAVYIEQVYEYGNFGGLGI